MYDTQTLIQLEDYCYRMADWYNNKWYEIGDDDYVMCKQFIKLLKTIRRELENRVDN